MVDERQQNGFLEKVDRFAESLSSLISGPRYRAHAKLAVYFLLIFVVVSIPVSLVRHVQTSGLHIVSVEREKKAGDKFAKAIEKNMMIIPQSDSRAAYVDEIGRRIAGANNPWNADFRFGVVEDRRMVNAFALPGGRIYVTTAMLDKLDSEAEMAAVLAHEVAHVTNRHYARNLGRQMMMSWAKKFLGGTDSAMMDAGSFLTSSMAFLKMKREDELEADYDAAIYIYNLDYDVAASVSVAEKLLEIEEKLPAAAKALALTHPPSLERVEAMVELKEQLYEKEKVVLGEERYREIMKKSTKKKSRSPTGLEFPIRK
jgi:predicted Zn-dependent protease